MWKSLHFVAAICRTSQTGLNSSDISQWQNKLKHTALSQQQCCVALICRIACLSLKVFEEWKHNRSVKSYALDAGGLLPRKTSKKEYELWTRPLQICLHRVSTTGCRNSFAMSFPFVVLNYLGTEAPPFRCKWKCCIKPFGHVWPKVSKIWCAKTTCVCCFNTTFFLSLF